MKRRIRVPGNTWDVLAHERFFRWRIVLPQQVTPDYEYSFVVPPQLLQGQDAEAMWAARLAPVPARVDSLVQRAQSKSDVAFEAKIRPIHASRIPKPHLRRIRRGIFIQTKGAVLKQTAAKDGAAPSAVNPGRANAEGRAFTR